MLPLLSMRSDVIRAAPSDGDRVFFYRSLTQSLSPQYKPLTGRGGALCKGKGQGGGGLHDQSKLSL